MTGAMIAFVATLVIAGVALSLAFDSVAIAITPALVIAGCAAAGVFYARRNRGSSV